jgi:hypothetical protein
LCEILEDSICIRIWWNNFGGDTGTQTLDLCHAMAAL